MISISNSCSCDSGDTVGVPTDVAAAIIAVW